MENDIIYLLYDSLYDSLLDCGCFLSDMSSEIRAYAADFMAGGAPALIHRVTDNRAGRDRRFIAPEGLPFLQAFARMVPPDIPGGP